MNYIQKEYLSLHTRYKEIYKNTPWYQFKMRKMYKRKAERYRILILTVNLISR
jgi:hypothetical protein